MKKLFKVMAVFVFATSAILNLVACNNQTGGSVNPCVHEWVVANTVVGTCSVEGKEEYECKKCDETKTESTGFGAHTTEQIFDGEYHWQVNTCEHENTPEKIAHSLTDGVCECGFYSIDKIVENYNALTVFEQDTNIHVEIDVDGEREFVLDFKDNVMKANNDNSFLYMIYEDGYLYQTYDGDAWRKVQASEFFGNEIKLVDVFAEMIYINPIISTLDVDFNWVESNKWEANFEGGGAKGKLTVITENGMVKKIDAKRVDSTVDNLLAITLSYGTADVGEVPEIDYDSVNGGGNADGPSDSNSIEEIIQNYNNLKVFEQGTDIRVEIGNEQGREFVLDFKDNIMKGYNGESFAYVIYEDGYLYESYEGSTDWGRISVDEFFEGEMLFVEFLGKMLSAGVDSMLNLSGMEFAMVENNKWEAIVADGEGKIVVSVDDGMVSSIDFISLDSEHSSIFTFTFSYGTADVSGVPEIDYDNVNDGGNTDPDVTNHALERTFDNMDKIILFDENNNVKFESYAYENSQWVLDQTILTKGNYLHVPPYFWSDGGSTILTYNTWFILDGDKVYCGTNKENLTGQYVEQYYAENGLEKTLELLQKAELSFQVFTVKEFAQEWAGSDSLEEVQLFGDLFRSARSFLYYDSEGVEYTQIDENKWQSNDVYGEIITVTIHNGFFAEIVYEDADTGRPLQKRVFEYGTVELPEIPDYKAE